MNLKSYIRGLGCGFILAGVILLVAFSASQNKSEKSVIPAKLTGN